MYQRIHNMNRLTKRDKKHKDLIDYHRLKRGWGLGHVKIKLFKCSEKYSCLGRPKRILHKNTENQHTIVMGYYVDGNNMKR